jgi:aminomethyltransferase
MGQVWVTGAGALGYLQNLVTNDISTLSPGQACYALMCNERGGVVDDLYVYRLAKDRFFLIINASRVAVDIPWMKSHVPAPAAAERGRFPRSYVDGDELRLEEPPQSAGVALQGPAAEKILRTFFPDAVTLKKNGVAERAWKGMEFLVARTGYTGEDGFEIFAPGGHIAFFYAALVEAGRPLGLELCGLGARDTLRLEMGYRLYGNDLDENHTGLEAGLGWVIKFDKDGFIGRDALLNEKEAGPRRRFFGFKLKDKGVPRHGYPILFEGRPSGEVTSGTFSPSLQIGLGMGFVDAAAYPREAQTRPGLAVEIHGRTVPAEAAPMPFYKKSS